MAYFLKKVKNISNWQLVIGNRYS